MHKNQTNRTMNHCEYLLLNQVLIHSLEHVVVSSQSYCLSPFLFPLAPQKPNSLGVFSHPFFLHYLCFALAQALYSAFFFSLHLSELIIKCFNLSCMTCNHVRGFSANTIPNVESVKFPAFPSNNNDS